jgi:hypothetical protein
LPNGIKDLKTVKSGDPKPKKKTVATEKRVAAAIELLLPKATAHCHRLAGATAPGNVALDLCYVFGLKIGPPAGLRARARRNFSSGKIAAHWQLAVLPPYSPPLNLLDYGIWGVVQPKGKATAHPKMGALKQTIWQLRAAKVRRCCGEIAARSDRA